MKRSDFYLIKGNAFSDQINFCCRLVEKALTQNKQIHIHTEAALHNEMVSRALWTFKAESFLPNAIGLNQQQNYPITVDSQAFSPNTINSTQLLILLTSELPDHYEQVERISLVVINQEQAIQRARAHYRLLKMRGIEVHYHDQR